MDEDIVFTIKNIDKFRKEYKDYEYYEEINDSSILSLVEAGYFKRNKELKLYNSESITTILFKKLIAMSKSRFIRILKLKDIPILDKAFIYLSQGSQLEEIHIKDCSKLQDKGLIKYFSSKSCRLLREINLDSLSISNEVLITLIKNYKNMPCLEGLRIINCINIDSESIEHLFTDKFFLKTLHLEEISIEDAALEKISKKQTLKFLENLYLIKIDDATDIGFSNLINSIYLKQLKKLKLENLPEINTKTIKSIKSLNHLESLELISMGHFTFEDLEPVLNAHHYNRLKLIRITDTTSIDDEVLQHLINNSSLKSLENIDFSDCSDISSLGFEKILKSEIMKKIKILNFENCTFITDLSFDSKKNLNLESLEFLNLKGCNSITTTFFNSLSNIPSLKNLKTLKFSNIINLNDSALTFLSRSKNFKSLNAIYLDFCHEITSKGFDDLVKGEISKNLEIISLENCSKIDDNIFDSIINSKKINKLREIYLDDCKITSEGVDKLIFSKKMINIEILGLPFGYYAFPSFYQSENCLNLKKIIG